MGLVIHWPCLSRHKDNRAVVRNDLETQRCERLSARSADTRKIDRACALVTFDSEADVDVPL